jgi:hypothetical protein
MPGKKYNSIKKPKAYEKVKAKLIGQGVPTAAAKTSAARITNAQAKKSRKKSKKGKK